MHIDLDYTEVPALHEEQRCSHISSGHRLVKLVRQARYQLYNNSEFLAKAIRIPADYWLSHFISSAKLGMNQIIAQRVSASIGRARKYANRYAVKKVSTAEYVTETFFDNYWFKPQEANLSRVKLRDHIKQLLDKGAPIRLLFPILSRKPYCPLKNRGPNPDLAELHTLIRCDLKVVRKEQWSLLNN